MTLVIARLLFMLGGSGRRYYEQRFTLRESSDSQRFFLMENVFEYDEACVQAESKRKKLSRRARSLYWKAFIQRYAPILDKIEAEIRRRNALEAESSAECALVEAYSLAGRVENELGELRSEIRYRERQQVLKLGTVVAKNGNRSIVSLGREYLLVTMSESDKGVVQWVTDSPAQFTQAELETVRRLAA